MLQYEHAHDFTLKHLFLGDMILNWFLGGILLFFPMLVDMTLGVTLIIPLVIYRFIGLLFWLFAAWQSWMFRRGRLGLLGLIFAALLAFIPVIALTVALVFMDFPLRIGWRIIHWIGDVYMFFLCAWYFLLAWKGHQNRDRVGFIDK